MPTKGTARRTVRITDDLWSAAAVKAEKNGTSISEVLRAALVEYVGPARALCLCTVGHRCNYHPEDREAVPCDF